MSKYENYNTKIPIKFQKKWQTTLNALTKICGSSDAMITKYNKNSLDVFKTSVTKSNVFIEGMTFNYTELFCGLVIKKDQLVSITNALEKESLKKYIEAQAGYTDYLGIPIKWPSGTVFGTLCIHFEEAHKSIEKTHIILYEMKELIESHLEIIIKDMAIESEKSNVKIESNKYKTLVDQAPIGIFKTAANGNAISINKTMASILGFSSTKEALNNYNNLNNDLFVDSSRRKELIDALKIKGAVKNFEYEVLGKHDKCLWLSINAKKGQDINSENFFIRGFAFDITERRKKDEELKIQKKELIKAYEQLTTYNEEILAMNEELEASLDQINELNERYINMIELVSKTKERNILNDSDFFNDLLIISLP